MGAEMINKLLTADSNSLVQTIVKSFPLTFLHFRVGFLLGSFIISTFMAAATFSVIEKECLVFETKLHKRGPFVLQ